MTWQASLARFPRCPFAKRVTCCRTAPKGEGTLLPLPESCSPWACWCKSLWICSFHMCARSIGFASLCFVESSTALPFLHRLVTIPPTLAVMAYSSRGMQSLWSSCLGSKISAVTFMAAPWLSLLKVGWPARTSWTLMLSNSKLLSNILPISSATSANGLFPAHLASSSRVASAKAFPRLFCSVTSVSPRRYFR